MKGIYKRVPSRREIEATYRKWAKEFEVPIPRIDFVEKGANACEDDYIELMSPEFVLKWGILDRLGTSYWTYIIHEFAHWFTFKRGITPEIDHNPLMYMFLVGLSLREGIPLDVLWDNEHRYSPGSLERGTKLAGTAVIENLMGRPPVTKSNIELALVTQEMAQPKAAHPSYVNPMIDCGGKGHGPDVSEVKWCHTCHPYPDCVSGGCPDHPWVL